MGNKKRKKMKELARQRKLQKERAVTNQKMEENLFYRIGSWVITTLLLLLKGMVMIVSAVFSLGSMAFQLLMILLLLILSVYLLYSLSTADREGMLVSAASLLILGSVWFLMRRTR
ncbi:hypothetical protein ACFQ49_11965 [Kroppenstedtia eburnea]|uniref:hypothetical protein n=1 Tax=Kroppenstedtia eburnea TaxID=714067 RepID=UPI00362B52B2